MTIFFFINSIKLLKFLMFFYKNFDKYLKSETLTCSAQNFHPKTINWTIFSQLTHYLLKLYIPCFSAKQIKNQTLFFITIQTINDLQLNIIKWATTTQKNTEKIYNKVTLHANTTNHSPSLLKKNVINITHSLTHSFILVMNFLPVLTSPYFI